MASVTILNFPATASLVESPTTFQVRTVNPAHASESQFQFVCDIYTWQGDIVTDKPASPSYVLNKFPVNDFAGQPGTIFDLSPILNSTMTASLADVYQGTLTGPIETPRWYTAEFYTKYYSNTINAFTTTSHQSVSGWDNFVALNGYNLWGERTGISGFTSLSPFSESVENYPILSTLPSAVTQSIVGVDSPWYFSVYALKDNDTQGQVHQAVFSTNVPSSTYTINLDTANSYTTSSRVVINTTVDPYMLQQFYDDGGDEVNIEIQDSLGNPIGENINYKLTQCDGKYDNRRIVFKNRYGAFDQFDFNMVSRKSFSTEVKSYKQNALETPLYSTYDTFKGDATYYTEGYETLTVNTDYIDEKFNDFFKGLLISDEIYLVESKPAAIRWEDGLGATFLPLVLTNNSVQFKTKKVDKLVQYTFEFRFSTPYKLTL